ncbi:hypothetical protein HU71_004800 [Salmonella enterica subsp. enterica]|nr:hypothetical protein [Salmonella enterica subsp. enterica]
MRLVQECRPEGSNSLYIYSDQGSYVPLARVDKAGANEPNKILYFHTDVNGAPEELTDSDGEIVWETGYQVWGNTIQEKDHGGVEQNLRYQGQYLDRETGLHYNIHRYFDPDVGRFTTTDPIGLAGGLNLYAYAPNPISWIDPLGLAKCNSISRPKNIGQKFSLLAKMRKKWGLPKAGSADDTYTVSMLEINGQRFYGRNGHGMPTTFDRVNPITRQHAEADVTQQAINAGLKGKAKVADIYVDRELCPSCGRNNGIGSLARELGLDSIRVHTRTGSYEYYPPGT